MSSHCAVIEVGTMAMYAAIEKPKGMKRSFVITKAGMLKATSNDIRPVVAWVTKPRP